MNGEFRSLLIAAKANVQEEAQGFGNGHSGYMVVGVDRDAFLDWAAKFNIFNDNEITSLKFEEGNGITVACFDTYEKHPCLCDNIKKVFPDADVYAYSMWDDNKASLDGVIINGKTDKYTKEIDECFADDGNLRLDVRFTDTASGCSFVVGDLLCYESVEDVEARSQSPAYKYLTEGLSDEEMAKVNEMAEECIQQMKEA